MNLLTFRYDPKYLVTCGLSHCDSTMISCWMSSISSSASSRSMILIATTSCVRLSMPLNTSPNDPFPIRSNLLKIVSGSTFVWRNNADIWKYLVFTYYMWCQTRYPIAQSATVDDIIIQNDPNIVQWYPVSTSPHTIIRFNTITFEGNASCILTMAISYVISKYLTYHCSERCP